jgi:hypothetical protein
VSNDTLEYGYSAQCMSMRVDRSMISEIEKIDLIRPYMDWAGYGIRKQLPAWDTGYISKKGPGIRITFKDVSNNNKEMNHTFCCNDPDKVIQILTR